MRRECYWGNSIAPSSLAASSTECEMSCGGDIFEACGGPNRINIYQDSAFPTTTTISALSVSLSPPTAAPTVVPSVGSFQSRGCFLDSVAARVLVDGTSVDHSPSGMTVEKCTALAAGWRYAGLEFSGYEADDKQRFHDPHADERIIF